MLHAEGRDKCCVQHILRSHHEFHRTTDRDIQILICTRRTRWIAEVERPLLRRQIDLIRVLWWSAKIDEASEPEPEHEHAENRWNDRPTEFEHRVM